MIQWKLKYFWGHGFKRFLSILHQTSHLFLAYSMEFGDYVEGCRPKLCNDARKYKNWIFPDRISLAIPTPMYKSLIYFFFFFLSGFSHNLNKYPNYHHCSSHIFVKSPEKSQKNTLPTTGHLTRNHMLEFTMKNRIADWA